MSMMMLLGMFLLAACGRLAPANVPPQLEYTPGPPVVLANGRYHSTVFAVDVPPAWQVITSPTSSAPWVVFVSPDDDAVIVIAVDEQDTQDLQPNHIEGDLIREEELVQLDNAESLHAVLIAGDEILDDYGAVFQRTLSSIAPPTP